MKNNSQAQILNQMRNFKNYDEECHWRCQMYILNGFAVSFFDRGATATVEEIKRLWNLNEGDRLICTDSDIQKMINDVAKFY